MAANVRTDTVSLSVKINDEPPKTISGIETPEKHGILFRGEGVRLPGDGLERLYVSVTNYDDTTFLMKFEAGGADWVLVREAIC